METSLVGAWRLVSFEFRAADGAVIYPFGERARGTIIYTASARYSAQLFRVDRPRFASGDQMQAAPEELSAAFNGSISYFGSYEVDRPTSTIIHHVEGSLFPNMEGRDQERHFVLSEHRLQLTTQAIKLDGEKAVGVLVWERIE